jgi:hypothetical protein
MKVNHEINVSEETLVNLKKVFSLPDIPRDTIPELMAHTILLMKTARGVLKLVMIISPLIALCFIIAQLVGLFRM